MNKIRRDAGICRATGFDMRFLGINLRTVVNYVIIKFKTKC